MPPPAAPAPEAADPGPGERRFRGKVVPGAVRADLRKNKTERTRDRGWTRRYLDEGAELDDSEVEQVVGRSDAVRRRVLVDPAERAKRDGPPRTGLVTRMRGLHILVWDGAVEVPCSLRGALKSFATKERKVITVGDRVLWRPIEGDGPTGAGGLPMPPPGFPLPDLSGGDGATSGTAGTATGPVREGVIEAVEPRTSVLARADSRHPDREHVVVANVGQVVIVSSLRQPEFRPRLIDRYLVSAGKGGLEPVICLNKADLEPDASRVAETVALYRGLGYTIIPVSARDGRGIGELRERLAGRTSVFAGQSGVGKSSLLNAVHPGFRLRVGTVCAENDKGRHTTTEVTLMPLPGGGAVVDTPGIRSFGLWQIGAGEVEAYFPEIAALVGECRFSNCTHVHEGGCAVIAAADAGRIAEQRYESYLMIYESLQSGRIDPRE